MISAEEREQLDHIRDQEADIYAEVLFLVLSRLSPGRDKRLIADTVTGAFQDLNARAIECNDPPSSSTQKPLG